MLNPVSTDLEEDAELKIAKVLELHYGDGLVYLPRHQSETAFKMAKNQGFIDPEGYLTRKGRRLLAKHRFT